ncbi:hypothetical protein J2S43_001273 [Catenuloplanes nepalensis]|uniref:Uncharacterized protein n=1 Tax=Catenuloplanes nepalensis TaxID=587533 RepID=A0ABT9MMV3_9ACTN|nr:hypothetical protein [Catenuloplanes nepalensis]
MEQPSAHPIAPDSAEEPTPAELITAAHAADPEDRL